MYSSRDVPWMPTCQWLRTSVTGRLGRSFRTDKVTPTHLLRAADGLRGLKVLHAETHCRIAKNHEVASVVASHPSAAKYLQRDIGAELLVALHFRELDGECGPSGVEHIGRLTDAITAKQAANYVAEALSLGATLVAKKAISPSAFDMSEHSKYPAVGVR